MDVLIKPSRINGTVQAPQSKSIAIRLLFSSLLGEVSLDNLEFSDDVKAAMRALQSLRITYDNGKLIKNPLPGNTGTVHLGGSGTVLRFLLPVLSCTGIEATVESDETLQKRPIGVLYDYLNSHGVDLSADRLPLKIRGKLDTDHVEISGSESSQYISGFIFGLLLIGGGRITLLPPVRSSSYIAMTCNILNSIGAEVVYTGKEITVKPLESPVAYHGKIPGDFLLSSFYALGAFLTGGEVSLHNHIYPHWSPGDSRIVEVIGKSGATSILSNGIWKVKGGEKIIPFNEDVEDSPDMAVNLAALAYGTTDESTISGIELLRIKESDRIESISRTLTSYGSRVSVNDAIRIQGPEEAHSGITENWNDHRIAMLGAILSLSGGGIVKGAESESKSNPRFFQDLKKLGGDLR